MNCSCKSGCSRCHGTGKFELADLPKVEFDRWVDDTLGYWIRKGIQDHVYGGDTGAAIGAHSDLCDLLSFLKSRS